MTLGEKIKALRKDADLSLRAVGKKVGVDFTYLSKIENDKTDNRPPSAELLKRLAHALRGDEDELLILAGRIPDEAKQAIVGDKYALRFFRTLKGREHDQKFWDEVTKLAERQVKQKR
jgi:transcriptional regulator with XRE-family HTH domain